MDFFTQAEEIAERVRFLRRLPALATPEIRVLRHGEIIERKSKIGGAYTSASPIFLSRHARFKSWILSRRLRKSQNPLGFRADFQRWQSQNPDGYDTPMK